MRLLGQKASRYFILFMVLSLLGWLAETVFFWFLYGRFYDRGFMTLPFCTIYGCALLLVYVLIGIPNGEGGILLKWEQGGIGKAFSYFLLSALISTGLELVTGYFFMQVFGMRLWDYSSYRFHFCGYICLEYALLWGILVPLCMKYMFSPLKKWIFTMSAPYTEVLSAILAICACWDWGSKFFA